MTTQALEARYRSWASLHRDWQQQIRMGGMLLRTTEQYAQFSPIGISLVTPSEEVLELPSQVLQLIPGHGVAVQFGAEAASELERLEGLCQANPAEGSANPDDPQVGPPSSDDVASSTGGRMTDLSRDPVELRRQLEQMTVNQKRQAALSARREARILLIKDNQKAVHAFVLKNPGITLDEVEAIAKMPSVNPDALRLIANNRDWTRSQTICRNLVRNPKTPMREALALLEKLPMSDIRMMAKSSNVRGPIQQAARKKVNQ
jgi:hypothetical protein